MTNNNNLNIKTTEDQNYELPFDVATQNIKDYFEETKKDAHSHSLSWRHCYNVFKENRHHSDDNTKDYLSLHLAFYLASWGMYRGSCFLLDKDYKVHVPIVKIILDPFYSPLWEISPEELIKNENLDLLDHVFNRIRKAYADQQSSVESKPNNATDILITKILLGTLGCVPAFDTYLIETLRKYNFSRKSYSRESIKEIANYYLANKDEFEKLRFEMSECGTTYPPMKLMDMCLWQNAYDVALKNK